MGKMYNKGKMIQYGTLKSTNDNPLDSTRHEDEYVEAHLKSIQGKDIMWNEGHEAGTTFEEDGKLYGLVYWWDIVGIKE